jgi:hypothetical protein
MLSCFCREVRIMVCAFPQIVLAWMRRGFAHCDIKPSNVVLDRACARHGCGGGDDGTAAGVGDCPPQKVFFIDMGGATVLDVAASPAPTPIPTSKPAERDRRASACVVIAAAASSVAVLCRSRGWLTSSRCVQLCDGC